jgi:dienelactone hydrolase
MPSVPVRFRRGFALLLLTTMSAMAAGPSNGPALPPTAFALPSGLEDPQLSPDGSRMAGVVRRGDWHGVVTRKVDGSQAQAAYATRQADTTVRLVRWLGNGRLLLSVTRTTNEGLPGEWGLPIYRWAAVDLDGQRPKVLEDDQPGSWTNVPSTLVPEACPSASSVLLRSATQRDLIRLDALSGTVSQAMRVGVDEIASQWWADPEGRVRWRQRWSPGGDPIWSFDTAAPGQRAQWRDAPADWGKPQPDWSPLGFDGDRQTILFERPAGDGVGIVRWQLQPEVPPREEVVAVLPGRVDRLIRNESNCRAVGAVSGGQSHFWGDRLPDLLQGLAASLPGRRLELLQWQGDRYLLQSSEAHRPPEYWVGERSAGRLTHAGVPFTQLPETLPLMRRKAQLANDALAAQWLLPQGAAGPQPTVICLACELSELDRSHGDFQPLSALLAQRGWAVFSVARWPSETLKPSIPETIEARRTVLRAAITDLVSQGQIDPGRIAIVSSDPWHGVMAFALAHELQPRPAALVAFGPRTDMTHWLQWRRRAAGRGGLTLAFNQSMVGSLDENTLRARSPVQLAPALDLPILLVIAEFDGLALRDEPALLLKALSRSPRPPTVLNLPSAPHDFDLGRYRQQVFEAIERHLAPALTPRP